MASSTEVAEVTYFEGGGGSQVLAAPLHVAACLSRWQHADDDAAFKFVSLFVFFM